MENKWISVSERLPEEGKYILVLVGKSDPQVACMRKGISKAEREQMIRGEIPDPCEIGWDLGCSKIRYTPRSRIWKAYDEEGNNLVPYGWCANGGPMQWFGQDVTHWMPIPEISKLEVDSGK